ncbi:MAG: dihydrofolate reductase [Thermoactinospora sp.]|nr:dihydrofolate reductase [Thermoactinospora sp.]
MAVLLTSLDGVVEGPERWQFPYLDAEIGDTLLRLYARSDTLLLGRVTYEILAAVWPARSGELADLANGVAKVVVSTTLERAWWSNTTVFRGEPADAVNGLRRGPGRQITVLGSVTLIRSLLRANLIDELRLLVHPIILGRGRRLFDEFPHERAGEVLRLTLTGLVHRGAGVLDLRYRPARHPTTERKDPT